MIRPSSLPALKECPRFESGSPRSFTLDGTLRHEALEAMWKNGGELPADYAKKLDDESIEGIQWGYDYIQTHAPMKDHELHIERKMEILDDDFNTVMSGTLDYQCGNKLFDIKWRQRNYLEQMACYALMMIQECGWPTVDVHILFMHSQRTARYSLDEAKCWDIINSVKEPAEDPFAEPVPCDYCGWCKHTVSCEAFADRTRTINAGREDWELENYHASQIENPVELSKALKLARAVKKWAEAVEYTSRTFIMRGGEIPGFELRRRAGKRKINNIADAFARCGLEQSEFLDCCQVVFSKLTERRRAQHGVSKRVATKELERLLGDALERNQPSYEITKTKS